jgi:hypothetical protein
MREKQAVQGQQDVDCDEVHQIQDLAPGWTANARKSSPNAGISSLLMASKPPSTPPLEFPGSAKPQPDPERSRFFSAMAGVGENQAAVCQRRPSGERQKRCH